MNIFEQFVLPPTSEHNSLLIIIQIISFMIYYPFIGMLTGGLILSKYFNWKAKSASNPIYKDFADDISKKLTFSKGAGYGLGFLPIFSIALVYSQFLYSSKIAYISTFLISAILYLISLVFVYKYKSLANTESVISFYNNTSAIHKSLPEDVLEYETKLLKNKNSNLSLAIYGLLISTFFFIGGITLSDNMADWSSFSSIFVTLINLKVWINFIFFLIIAFTVTGSGIIFLFFNWEGGIKFKDNTYRDYIRTFSSNFTLIFSLALPIFLIISLILQPKESYSASVFIFSGLSLFALLLASNFLYAVIKNSDAKYGTAIFYLIIAAISFMMIKNQVAFSNAINSHLIKVNHFAEEEIKAKYQKKVSLAQISGEDIYNGRCSACHKFDVKLIGPPYLETVPKYGGDEKKLAQFIYNPTKVNPDYPPMPNQGLKMAEAEAVAKFIIEKVNKK